MGSSLEQDLLERVIPLPKRARISGVERIPGERVGILVQGDAVVLRTAVNLLQRAIPGAREGSGDYTLALTVIPDDPELLALSNADQAYAIRPQPDKGLLLCGLTGVGVLNAARTLAQLVRPAGDGGAEIPQAAIVDWPDLEERGQWGGNAEQDIPWTAPLKMNMVESGVKISFVEGRIRAEAKAEVLQQAREQGVKVVLFIPHIGELGWSMPELFNYYPEVAGTPDPTKPLPPDYKPILCFSKPETARLLANLMVDAARTEGIEELNVWLTESDTRCYCELCKPQQTYELEVRGVVAGYRLAQQVNPRIKLRLLLTQGSYPFNDLVLKVTPPDVKITYYHGGLTYDSSHKPMIYPLLEDYARRGGWLGVYPQLDNAWRTVFPFTGPQFIRFRMQEFASKGLKSVTGYATPSNRFWEFNVAAEAEWSWNSAGRDEYQFARAWARRKGVKDVDLYARWAVKIGPLGWDLAGSRIPMSFFWDPARTILEGNKPLVFGEGLLAEIPSAEHLEGNITAAREALAMAQELGDTASLAESQVILHTYLFIRALIEIAHAPRSAEELTGEGRARLAEALAALDHAAEQVVKNMWVWGHAVVPDESQTDWHRFQETMSVFAQVVMEAYKLGARLGLADPRPWYRDQLVGHWTTGDFPRPEATLRFEVTDRLHGPGIYRPMFRFKPSAYGVDINAVSLLEDDGRQMREVMRVTPSAYGGKPHPGPFEPWNDDARLELAEVRPGCRYFLQVELTGIPADAPADRRSCEGDIFLRQAWA